MTLIAVPNVSEGENRAALSAMVEAVAAERGRVLDVHSDEAHHRSVITLTAPSFHMTSALARLAEVASEKIDLSAHEGVHPRLGALDVCPIVPLGVPMKEAISMAQWTGRAIFDLTGLPIYFYGHAATRAETEALPAIRTGGLPRLIRRARSELPPDLGGPEIDPRRGVVCVGARGPLIAFNVWIRGPVTIATGIANTVRSRNVRALGFEIDKDISQVSMNLIDPEAFGIDAAFGQVDRTTEKLAVKVVATEIVGLVEERFLPAPNAQAARLLLKPGRSLESVLGS